MVLFFSAWIIAGLLLGAYAYTNGIVADSSCRPTSFRFTPA